MAVHQAARELGELIGTEFGRLGRQLSLGVLTRLDVDGLGQLVEKPTDHRHVVGADRPVALGRRRGGQHRRQRLARQRPARTQVGGLSDPAAGFGPGEVQAIGQHPGQPATRLR